MSGHMRSHRYSFASSESGETKWWSRIGLHDRFRVASLSTHANRVADVCGASQRRLGAEVMFNLRLEVSSPQGTTSESYHFHM